MKSILLIENQEYQFKKIVEGLSRFNLTPKPSHYIDLIDNVRVWVNKEYNDSYVEDAIKNIEDTIKHENIELIIMDHILGGAHYCDSGIELADELNTRRQRKKKVVLPVFFLSKTEHNIENRIAKFELYQKKYPDTSRWIHKGYFGDEILKVTYLKEQVANPITEFFERYNPTKPILTDFEKVFGFEYEHTYNFLYKKLKKIENHCQEKGLLNELPNDFKKMINEAASVYEIDDNIVNSTITYFNIK